MFRKRASNLSNFLNAVLEEYFKTIQKDTNQSQKAFKLENLIEKLSKINGTALICQSLIDNQNGNFNQLILKLYGIFLN